MKVAILGAVHGTSESERLIFETYKAAVMIKKEDAEIVSPSKIEKYRDEFAENNPKASETEIIANMVNFDLSEVLDADIVLADVSLRSTGLGMELGYLRMNALLSQKNKTKLFLFAKAETKVSDMVKGGFPNNKIYTYTSADDLAELLDKIL